MEWHSFTDVSLEILLLLWHQSPSYSEKLKCLNGLLNVKSLGKIFKTSTFKMYSSRLFNFVERNYTITHREVLAMVYALHKLRQQVHILCRPYGFNVFS
jgi:hypothetical protein